MWAHVGNNFVLDFHEDELRDVQPRFEIDTGVWGRSFQAVELRAADQQPRRDDAATSCRRRSAATTRSRSATAGARRTRRVINHRGGNVDARYRPTACAELGRHLARRANSESHLNTNAFYVAGHLHREPADAEPRLPLRHPGRRGAGGAGAGQPALPDADARRSTSTGADAGVVWKDFSPRLGMTYDLTGNGKTVAARVLRDLLRPDGARPAVEPARRDRRGVRPLPLDRHQRRHVRAGQRGQHDRPFLEQERGLRPGEPDQLPSRRRASTRTSRTTAPASSSSASTAAACATWPSAAATSGASTTSSSGPTATTGPAPTTAVTYHADELPGRRALRGGHLLPAERRRCRRRTSYTNQPGSVSRLQRLRADAPQAPRRTAGRRTPATPTTTPSIMGFAERLRGSRPTSSNLNGAQYAPESAGSRHRQRVHQRQVAVQGQRPLHCRWDINVAASYQARQGYPVPAVDPDRRPRQRRRPTRASSSIRSATCACDNLSDVDFRVDKTFRFGSMRIIPTMDVFNLTNTNDGSRATPDAGP